jgi:hypothetical protein
MRGEPLRFKKSSHSGGQSDCVEVAHTVAHLRDSKQPGGATLRGDVPAMIEAVKSDRVSPRRQPRPPLLGAQSLP